MWLIWDKYLRTLSYISDRGLQDHESVYGCDLPVAAQVRGDECCGGTIGKSSEITISSGFTAEYAENAEAS